MKSFIASLVAVALIFVVPWLFELYTFHLYEANDNSFFAYSGGRTAFFVASVVVLGYVAGWNARKAARNVNYYAIGCAAAALSLVMVLYQFCNATECYYVGPDGLGEVRLFLLLFSASEVGLILGSQPCLVSNKKGGRHVGSSTSAAVVTAAAKPSLLSASSIHPLFALAMVAIFIGIYPAAWLYDVPSEPTFRVFLFIYYVTVPFLLAGLVASQLGKRSNDSYYQRWQGIVVASALVQAVLYFLFGAMTFPDGGIDSGKEAGVPIWQAVQLAIAISCSALSGIAGSRIGSSRHYHQRRLVRPNNSRLDGSKPTARTVTAYRKMLEMSREKLFASPLALIFLGFAIFAAHPLLLAPIDLLPPGIENAVGNNDHRQHGGDDYYLKLLSSVPSPMHYAGAGADENYHSTKRVEVSVNFTSLYPRHANNDAMSGSNNKDNASNIGDVVIAGMGAQSPNCCKDGLDYGYRADVLFTNNGATYLVARAWETCDQNAACSGFPWRSIMHESVVPIKDNYIPKSSLDIAMEWAKDGRTANWYYRTMDNQGWIKYSSFTAPLIENLYFNLGVSSINDFLPTKNRLINSLYEDVNFFQVGIATSSPADGSSAFAGGKVVFECPAYYDNKGDGEKHCFSNMAAVPSGNSYWKVLWGWGGEQPDTSSIQIDNLKKSVEMTI